MAATKLKTGVIGAIVVASVVTPLVVQHQAHARLLEQDQVLRERTDRLNRQLDLKQACVQRARLTSEFFPILAGEISPRLIEICSAGLKFVPAG